MKRWLLACAAILAVSAVVSLLNGHAESAAISAGLIVVGLAGAYLGPRYRGSRSVEFLLGLYTTLFNAGLVTVTILLIVAAVESPERERGGYIGLGIFVGSAALALTPVTVALWKRFRSRTKPGGSDVADATEP